MFLRTHVWLFHLRHLGTVSMRCALGLACSLLLLVQLAHAVDVESAGALRFAARKQAVEVPWGERSVEIVYKFLNAGKEPVALLEVRSSCACTSYSFSRDYVLPGHEGQVKMIVDVDGRIGEVIPVQLAILSTEAQTSQAPYILTATVNSVNLFTVQPRLLIWKLGEFVGKKAALSVSDQKNGLREPVSVAVESSSEDFSAKIVPSDRKGLYWIEVRPVDAKQKRQAVISVRVQAEGKSVSLPSVFAYVTGG